MKKWTILLTGIALILALGACAAKEDTEKNDVETIDAVEENNNEIKEEHEDKTLILYFSESGNTEVIGNEIHEQIGGDIVKIVPVVEYPHVYEELADYAKAERDNDERPAFQDLGVDPREYDVVFLGFPIWWHTAPTIINTFLESADFAGKTIVVFATSGSEPIEKTKTMEELEAACPKGAKMTGGKLLSRISDEEIESWAKSF